MFSRHVGPLRVAGDGVAGVPAQGHHLLGVHQVLGTAERDKGYFVWHHHRSNVLCFFRKRFRRLRTAGYFAHGGKVTKTPPGTQPMDYGSASLRLGP